MIAVLGGLADVERDLIRTRTAEGRSRAKARGQHMGRPSALTPQQQTEARKRRYEGATLKELAQSYNVGLATISRLSKEGSRMTAVTLTRTDHARRMARFYAAWQSIGRGDLCESLISEFGESGQASAE
jgi:DNA invertase Pin-like site-specific DNA recombinase